MRALLSEGCKAHTCKSGLLQRYPREEVATIHPKEPDENQSHVEEKDMTSGAYPQAPVFSIQFNDDKL